MLIEAAARHPQSLIVGVVLIVVSIFNIVFRGYLGNRDAAMQQARRDTAPGPFKRMYPQRGQRNYIRLNTASAVLLLIIGIVVVAVSA